MENTFSGVFQKQGDWYMAYVEELPGANTQGKTLEEAREKLPNNPTIAKWIDKLNKHRPRGEA